jgi:hypothetical protein
VFRNFVREVGDRLAREVAHRLNAYVDVNLTGEGDQYQLTLLITFAGGGTGKIIVAPIIQGVIPVIRSGQDTTANISSADEAFLKSRTEELTSEIFPRYVARMLNIELR